MVSASYKCNSCAVTKSLRLFAANLDTASIATMTDSTDAAKGTTGSNNFPAAKQAEIDRLRAIMENGEDQSRWSKAWQANMTPWDSGGVPQPSLVSFVQDTPQGKALLQSLGLPSDTGAPSKARALVPGCGRGYDVEFFAWLGFGEVLGVDIAPEAVQAAEAWVGGLPSAHAANTEKPAAPGAAPRSSYDHLSRVHFKALDYFAAATEADQPLGQFDLIYDYTFFCALPPQLRPRWAEAHAKSTKKGAALLTMVYPIQGDRPGGPPVGPSI